MTENTVNQRLKILIETLNLKVRTFSQALGVSEGTTRNYLDRGTKPGADYLEKIVTHFPLVNLTWLIAGVGEPMTGKQGDFNDTSATVRKNSGVVGTNGTQYNIEMPSNLGDCQQQLTVLTVENEGLRRQLQLTEALLRSKEELLTLLRGGYNRPN